MGETKLRTHAPVLRLIVPVVPSADGSLKGGAQLLQGSSLLALKRFSEAIAPLEAFLASKPTGDAAVKGMGELAISYARNNQLDRAKQLFAELAEKYAEHPLLLPTAEHLAEAAYDANDIAWSTELSARLAKSDPSSEYYRKGKLGLGWSQYKAGNLGEAADVFDQLLKANPPEGMAAEAAMARGQILERLEQEESAAAMYAVVIEQYPKSKQHGDALFAAARLCVKQKRHATAASHFERFAKDHAEAANLDVALYEWAWALLESNQGDASADRFRQLHQAHRESRYWGEAAYRLAQRAFEAKEYGQAAALAAEVLQGKSEPRVREYAAYLRGQIAVAQSDWPKTREAFETFVKEFGDSPQCIVAEFWIAETFYRQEDWKTASERFDRLAKQVETGREAWMAMIPLRRAQLAVQRNEWGEAFEIASRIAADFAAFEQHYEVDYVLGRCLANRADFEGARRAYGKVIQSTAGAKTETAAMAQWMIGESFFHQKNYKAALSEYLRLEILYAYPTWQSAALLQAGKCHELLGEGKEATELYRRIVTLYPDTPFAKEASQKLQDATARRTAGERTN